MFISIHLVTINEQGKEVSEFGNFAPILNYADSKLNKDDYSKEYIWLYTIEPYGDTYFNHLQAAHLKTELRKLQNIDNNAKINHQIDKLITYIDQLETSTNLKFMGD